MFRVIACVALAVLAGCHRETRSDDQRTATGQVLAGSISDSMIPYEQLQSRPPAAPRVVEKPVAQAGETEADSGGGADTSAPEEAPAAAAGGTATIHY